MCKHVCVCVFAANPLTKTLHTPSTLVQLNEGERALYVSLQDEDHVTRPAVQSCDQALLTCAGLLPGRRRGVNPVTQVGNFFFFFFNDAHFLFEVLNVKNAVSDYRGLQTDLWQHHV